MKNVRVEGTTLPEAYHSALMALKQQGEHTPVPDWNTSQLELQMTMVVNEPLKEPMISKFFIGGPKDLEQYGQEILYGILDFEVEKGNWPYTYHKRMEDQFDFIIDELKRNPYSRRAVIVVRDKVQDMASEDPACLQHIQYFIRNNKLDSIVLFRSNDACKAAFMNAFGLIMLQKWFADRLGVEVGTYTHIANSFHCYEKDFGMLDGYVNRILKSKSMDELRSYIEPHDTAYNYVGDWEDEMIAAQESIALNVAKLKSH